MINQRRVLLCCEHYPPSVGGVQEVMRQIAERLVRKGISVTVATSMHQDRSVVEKLNGVDVISFEIMGNMVHGIKGDLSKYHALLTSSVFDAVLIKAAQQWTFDGALAVLDKVNCKKVFIPCGFSCLNRVEYKHYYQSMPEWLRMFDELIFYSQDYQDISFARHHDFKTINIIPNGVDEREFEDLNDHSIRTDFGISPKTCVILSVGSRIVAKGHWDALKAYGRANLNNRSVLIINSNTPSGDVSANLKRQLKTILSRKLPLEVAAWLFNLRNSKKKAVITDLPRDKVIDLYKTAQLFLFASHTEYSPLVLLEACAAGTPFISRDVGNAKYIASITGGGTVPVSMGNGRRSQETIMLKTALEHSLSDLDYLKMVGLKARRIVFDRGFTWDAIVERYEDVLFASRSQK
jgi:glycosyltransferase involved in cell wall biosynthesis